MVFLKNLFKRKKEPEIQERPSGLSAFEIGQRIYAALKRASEQNPKGIQVRNSYIGGSQYRIDVGFPDARMDGKFSFSPEDKGELAFQVFIDTSPEEKGIEIKVAYGDEYHPWLTPLYSRDPPHVYDKIEAFGRSSVDEAGRILANQVRVARRKMPSISDLLGWEPSRN